jgi:hypothetical protein
MVEIGADERFSEVVERPVPFEDPVEHRVDGRLVFPPQEALAAGEDLV